MTELTQKRVTREVSLKQIELPLADGDEPFEGGIACIDLATGEVVVGVTGTGLLAIGRFVRDFMAGDTTAVVRLWKEIVCYWWANASDVDAADIGGFCYLLDDQTATASGSGKSLLGRVWGVDTRKGVLVEGITSVAGVPGAAGATGPTGPTGPTGATGS